MNLNLPRVLVLDDLTGTYSEQRRVLCDDLALADVSQGERIQDTSQYLAEVVFDSCQVKRDGEVRNDVDAAVHAVGKGWNGDPERPWALVLLDLQFDYGPPSPYTGRPSHTDPFFGLRILQQLANKWPDPRDEAKTAIPVVTLSTKPRAELEAELNNLGNLEYLERDPQISRRELRYRLAECLFTHGLLEDGPLPSIDESGTVHWQWDDKSRPIVGKSRALLRALRDSRIAAKADWPCLVMGPSGSGKELFANYIHRHSARSESTFLAYNCAGVTESLLVSELFGIGHRRATGVDRSKGVFRQADKGTLFLDEIGDMSPNAQAMVLRTIQFGEIQPTGEPPQKVDVRVLAATNKDLIAMANIRQFRPDLLSRMKSVVDVPSLKERGEDVCLLFNFFLKREIENRKGRWPKQIKEGVYEALRVRGWAGNVRDMESLVTNIAEARKTAMYIVPTDIPRQQRERSSMGPEPVAPPGDRTDFLYQP